MYVCVCVCLRSCVQGDALVPPLWISCCNLLHLHWDPCNTALLWWSQTSVHILYCTEKTPLTYITLIFTSNCGVISSLLQSCLDLFGNNTVLLTQSVIVYVLSASFYLSHPFFFCVCVCVPASSPHISCSYISSYLHAAVCFHSLLYFYSTRNSQWHRAPRW